MYRPLFYPFLNLPFPLRAPDDETGSGDTGDTSAPAGDETTETKADETSESSNSEDTGNKSLLSKSGEGNEEDKAGKNDDKSENTETTPITMEEIKLPEGIEIPENAQAGFLELVNNQELTRPELVNKLLEMQGDAMKDAAEANIKAWVDIREGWREEAAALPEIGGDKFEGTLASIKTGLDAVGATPEAYAALDATGAGDNPHLISLLHKLVQPFLERNPATGTPATSKGDRASRMFPGK